MRCRMEMATEVVHGWGQLGLPWNCSPSTMWGDQEWIISAGWITSGYNLGGRRRLVLPLTTRSLWSDRISSSSPIIICTINIISFRTSKLWECMPGIWNAGICCEPFEKTVGTALSTALALQVVLEGVALREFVGWCSELARALFFAEQLVRFLYLWDTQCTSRRLKCLCHN